MTRSGGWGPQQPHSSQKKRRLEWATQSFVASAERVPGRQDDLAPIESWGDSGQNCLYDMRIVGNTQLVGDGQQ